MASAPVIVFFYDRTFIRGSFREAWRRHRALLSALACTWLVLGCAVVSAPDRGGTAGFGAEVPWSRYLLAQFPAMVHYLRLAIWPDPLVFDYGAGLARSPWEVFPAAAIVILLIVASLLLCFAKRSWRAGRVRNSLPQSGGRRRDGLGCAGRHFFLRHPWRRPRWCRWPPRLWPSIGCIWRWPRFSRWWWAAPPFWADASSSRPNRREPP